MDSKAIEFPYNTEVISEEAFKEHMKLYEGYVTKVNNIDGDFKGGEPKSGRSRDSMLKGMKRDEQYSLNGIILHEEYFRNMTTKKNVPGEKTRKLIEKYFGTMEKFISCFIENAAAAQGWCVLAYEQRTCKLRILMLDAHDTGVVFMACPLLVLDLYEHAYYFDYKTDKKKYIEAFMNNINWDIVEMRADYVYSHAMK